MPYAKNESINIYYEVEGDGPPLVLQHGFTRDLSDWRDFGYVAALKNDYQLILVDARGHGSSDKPHHPEAYSSKVRVGDILAVLDALSLDETNFLGYSMGGWIGFALAEHAPERLSSLAIGGIHPYKREPGPLNERVEMLRNEAPDPDGNDSEALIASTLGIRDDPGFANVLDTFKAPCLVYVGENDGLAKLASETSKDQSHVTFVTLPGLDHPHAFFQSEKVLPCIREFFAIGS
jgi:pimeloyl-ACP methyl ester carboxylesterase